MQVKIDTKEKFHVITPIETEITATMTEGMGISLLPFTESNIKNVVLNMEQVAALSRTAAEKLVQIQQHFYAHNASFVICNVHKEIETALLDADLLELLNVTPTQSEAGDIVQMEEIERELLD